MPARLADRGAFPSSAGRRLGKIETSADNPHRAAKGALLLGALGVVYGDIGTSPLYTIPTIFNPEDPHPVALTEQSLFGVLSLIFWSVMTIVTLTYVVLVMRADNHGEGGIMALITRLSGKSAKGSAHTKLVLVSLGIFGAALFFGDSMITPAISVLSAVEGLKVDAPRLEEFVLPITAGIIVALFAVQRFGTHTVGRAFGPVMIVWFSTLAALGIHGIAQEPEILKALSPTYAATYIGAHPATAFFALGSVILAVTGAEALYADMGHFGRRPIVIAWLFLVLPACTLNYFGQGALILGDRNVAFSVPFFELCPDWAHYPLVLLATMATVIASQAVITGAYSVVHQAIRLGYLPRLRIQHTSAATRGQIYVPWINWLLMMSVLLLIFTFESSTKLAFAYGVAVTGTITLTTLLFLYFARQQWGVPLWAVIGGGAILISIDLLFLAANLLKLFHGAWLPLLVGALAFTVMITWKRGVAIVTRKRNRLEPPLREFISDINRKVPPLPRPSGTAVFLDRDATVTPLAMRALVKHLRLLPERVVVLTLETAEVPHMRPGELLRFDDLGNSKDQITQVTATFGYMDPPNVPLAMRAIADCGELDFKVSAYSSTYYLSQIELQKGEDPEMPRWQRALFIATSHLATDPADYFALPGERAVILGSKLEI